MIAAEQALWAHYGATPKERFLELAKPRIKVRVLEVGDGPPAVFVHGAMTGGSSFASLASHLPGIRCILLDRPGCVSSDPWPLDGPEFRTAAVDVLGSVLDALDLRSAIFVGNSLGAMCSTWFAIAHPERVTHLALLGPSIGFAGVRAPVFMRLVAIPGLRQLMAAKMRPDVEALKGIFAEMGHAESIAAGRIPTELFAWGVRMHAETPTARNELENIRRAVGLFGARRWTTITDEELRSLAPPMLIVSGKTDTHGGPVLASRIAELVPHAKLEIVTSGHLPWLDDPAAIATLLERFVGPRNSG